MKKVAVFGNAGGGKSTLSKKLAEITGLPLHILDKIQYQTGGEEIENSDFKQVHDRIINSNEWIIDGYGCLETLWQRLDVADTLIYIDLPLSRHFFWVSKRLIMGLFRNPEGWPENSPIIKSSLNSYSVLLACHKKLTPIYREYVKEARNTKKVYHLQSVKSISQFLKGISA